MSRPVRLVRLPHLIIILIIRVSPAHSPLTIAGPLMVHHPVQPMPFLRQQGGPLILVSAKMTEQADRRHAQPMHQRRPKHNEADDWPDRLNRFLMRVVLRRMRVLLARAILELRAGFNGEEQAAQAHGTEVPAEERLRPGLDVGRPGFHGEDDGDAAEEEDEDEQTDESARGDVRHGRRRSEMVPGNDGADVDEHAGVEDEIEDGGQLGLAHLLPEPAIPGEAVARPERDQEVVHAQGTADADREHGEEEVEDQEAGPIDVVVAFHEPEHPVEEGPDAQANHGAQQTLPQQRPQEPLLGRFCLVCLDQEHQADIQEREADPIIARALRTQHMLQAGRDPHAEGTLGQHRGGEHGIGGGQTGTHHHRRRHLRLQHGIHEAGADDPAHEHDRPQHDGHALPMPAEIGFRQIDADGQDLQADDDAGGFLRNVVLEAP